jgi:hypothetical protein
MTRQRRSADSGALGPAEVARARRVTRAAEGWRTAAEVLGALTADTAVCVVTRGQISMIDVIREAVRQLGAHGSSVEASVWTWCIAAYEVEAFEYFLSGRELSAARLVIDRSAEQRNRPLIDRWRRAYGVSSVRVCLNHAKIATISNGRLRVAVRGSMNLNFNPRFEQFDLSVNDGVYDLVRGLEDRLPVLPVPSSWSEAAAASQVQAAFSDEALATFQGVRTWAK